MIRDATRISRCLARGGRAVLSGFRPNRVEDLAQAYERAGYERLWAVDRDDWGCVVVRAV